MPPPARIVYSPAYNLGAIGVEKLHPFDIRKYGRAYRALRRQLGSDLQKRTHRPVGPVGRDTLRRVHTDGYLEGLRHPATIAAAVEVPQLRHVPGWLLDRLILRPMRWATAGTILAAREAVQSGGVVVNLGGGYHHAAPQRGHGFCLYADVALAVDELRRTGLLDAADRIVHIDCDAHQGDGVCHCFQTDPRVFLFDMYNDAIFPNDPTARRRIDCDVPLPLGCDTGRYLTALRQELPRMLDALSRDTRISLAFYNAGTDILAGDALGAMCVSEQGILERDQFVLDQLIERRVPTVMLTSGGYTGQSHRLIVGTLEWLLGRAAVSDCC